MNRALPVSLMCVLLALPTLGCAADLTWTNLGPGGGGWIQSICFDPHDPDTIYLGCDVGGFYLSRDAGRSWTIHNDGLTDYYLESIAVHPQDSRLLLVGSPGGLFKSTDQGLHWVRKTQGLPAPQRYSYGGPLGAVCFDPTRPKVVYAGIGRPREGRDGKGQIYRSEDTGETWSLVTPPGALDPQAIVSDLEVSPDGKVVLAATSKGLYRSDDSGDTWTLSQSGLLHGDVREVAFAPSAPQIVYATLRTTARDAQTWNGGVFRSEDYGKTWTSRSQGLAMRVGKTGQPMQMTSNYKEIAVDPRDPETVYVGDVAWVSAGVSKTTDGGRTWQKAMDRATMDYGWITQWGPAVECLSLCPTRPDRVVFGTSGQVFLTDDGAKSWSQRYCRMIPAEGDAPARFSTNGVEVTCAREIMPDPLIPGRVYFGYMDIGLLVSDDKGSSFRKGTQGMKFTGTCFSVTLDPTVRNKLWSCNGDWGSNNGEVCRSLDGGLTWTRVGTPETGLPNGRTSCLLLDPTSPAGSRRLYVLSEGNGVYTSADDGQSWKPVMQGLPEEAGKRPSGLLMDPANPLHLRCALPGRPSAGSGLYETRDGGATWTAVTSQLLGDAAPGPFFGDLKQLCADPKSFDTLYLCQRESLDRSVTPNRTLPGGLFKSLDGGRTWTKVFDFHFTNCVAVSPANSDVIYVGTTDHPYHDDCRAPGVFKSTDGGKTWQPENEGLSSTNISCLRVDPSDPSRVWMGTGGNGCFLGVDKAVR